jgi:hypothetical protein
LVGEFRSIYGFDVVPLNQTLEQIKKIITDKQEQSQTIRVSDFITSQDLTSKFRPDCYIANNIVCIDLDFQPIHKYYTLAICYYDDQSLTDMQIAFFISIRNEIQSTDVHELYDYSHNFLYIDLNHFNVSPNSVQLISNVLPLNFENSINHFHDKLYHYQTGNNNALINSIVTVNNNTELALIPYVNDEITTSTKIAGSGYLQDDQYYDSTDTNDQGAVYWFAHTYNPWTKLYLQNSQINKEYNNVVQFDDLEEVTLT